MIFTDAQSLVGAIDRVANSGVVIESVALGEKEMSMLNPKGPMFHGVHVCRLNAKSGFLVVEAEEAAQHIFDYEVTEIGTVPKDTVLTPSMIDRMLYMREQRGRPLSNDEMEWVINSPAYQ